MALIFLSTLLQAQGVVEHGTGREWMVIFSIVVPAVLLIVLFYLSRKWTV